MFLHDVAVGVDLSDPSLEETAIDWLAEWLATAFTEPEAALKWVRYCGWLVTGLRRGGAPFGPGCSGGGDTGHWGRMSVGLRSQDSNQQASPIRS